MLIVADVAEKLRREAEPPGTTFEPGCRRSDRRSPPSPRRLLRSPPDRRPRAEPRVPRHPHQLRGADGLWRAHQPRSTCRASPSCARPRARTGASGGPRSTRSSSRIWCSRSTSSPVARTRSGPATSSWTDLVYRLRHAARLARDVIGYSVHNRRLVARADDGRPHARHRVRCRPGRAALRSTPVLAWSPRGPGRRSRLAGCVAISIRRPARREPWLDWRRPQSSPW